MKNLKKALAVATAIAAMSMSMTALAATTYTPSGDLAFTYDQAANTVSVTASALAGAKADTEMTLVVLDKETDETNVQAANILYIDQETAGTADAFQAMGLKAASLADGAYKVKLGYTNAEDVFSIASGTLTVATTADGTKVTIKWGDVNADGDADTLDATAVISAYVGGTRTFADKYTWNEMFGDIKWGDVNADGDADTLDATAIISAYVGGTRTFADKYTWNESVEITVAE